MRWAVPGEANRSFKPGWRTGVLARLHCAGRRATGVPTATDRRQQLRPIHGSAPLNALARHASAPTQYVVTGRLRLIRSVLVVVDESGSSAPGAFGVHGPAAHGAVCKMGGIGRSDHDDGDR